MGSIQSLNKKVNTSRERKNVADMPTLQFHEVMNSVR